MEPLYILDLEGTTGIYTSSEQVNDMIALRPGFRELVDRSNRGEVNIAIATRAKRPFVDEIQKNLRERGIHLDCKIYTGEQLVLPDENMFPYKDYSQIYKDHGITYPEKQTVVLGDFLRFMSGLEYQKRDFMNFNFNANSSVLTKNSSLNDHPYPESPETPIYVALPQPWVYSSEGVTTLDMGYVMGFLQKMYETGGNDFKRGLDKLTESAEFQIVRSSQLASRVLKKDHVQNYLIMKGKNSDWRHLDKVM